MQKALVMTVIGRDRPGLVESVSGLVAKHGGNWLESRMSRLGGFFAGILRVEVPTENRARIEEALKGLQADGLQVIVHTDEPRSAAIGASLRLEIVGQDRPGIVRNISQALARHGVNVEEFSSETCSAAMSGENLFHAEATLSVPGSCDLPALQAELEQIAADLIVDVTFEELKTSPEERH
jgi:glycine cleavage system regulatory protein